MRTTRLLQLAGCGCLAVSAAMAIHCSGTPKTTSHPTVTTVPNDQATTYALAVDVPFAELSLPESSRPHGAPPERIPLTGFSTSSKDEQFKTKLPIRTRNLFFHRPPSGMEVVDSSGALIPHKSLAGADKPRWTFDQHSLTLIGDEEVESDEYYLVWPQATVRESRLNLAHSAIEDQEVFARQSIQAGPEYRSGLLLPAPATAAWDVTVPLAADLSFSPGLVQPEIADAPDSDGATLTVTITVDGTSTELFSQHLDSDRFHDQRIDLSAYAGKEARLTMKTDSGQNARFDYVFVAEPVLASRKEEPRQVVLIFVDTLRPDHLGTYGYERETSPALDAWSKDATVFEMARSVAPWTLPSTRSVTTGRHPEYYQVADTLQGRLRADGFASAMFAGNLYLGANFDMNRDWGLHKVTLWPSATDQVDTGIAWLEQQRGRDAVMLLHFMDAHLPYREPTAYRRMFAGDAPATLNRDEFHRNQVLSANLKPGPERQYVRDRYDNNIRYVDDQLARLFAELEEDAVVVYFSDHGEEFWEHKGYEHGHTLFDELLRVPLVIKAPAMPAGRVGEPVSLLDITPTVLDALGFESEGLDGTSLVPASRNDQGARAALSDRNLAFGRPLYGSERWGVLSGTTKYTTTEGREAAYNLETDPNEKANLFLKEEDSDPGGPYRPILGEALQREVDVGYRLTTGRTRNPPAEDTVVKLTVPGGVKAAWVGDEPTESSKACVTIEDEVVTAIWAKGYRGSREVYVIPAAGIENTTANLTAEMTFGEAVASMTVPEKKAGPLPKQRVPITRQKVGDRTVFMTWAIAPIPDDEMSELSGFDPELASQLQAMGYMVGDDEAESDGLSACQ